MDSFWKDVSLSLTNVSNLIYDLKICIYFDGRLTWNLKNICQDGLNCISIGIVLIALLKKINIFNGICWDVLSQYKNIDFEETKWIKLIYYFWGLAVQYSSMESTMLMQIIFV